MTNKPYKQSIDNLARSLASIAHEKLDLKDAYYSENYKSEEQDQSQTIFL